MAKGSGRKVGNKARKPSAGKWKLRYGLKLGLKHRKAERRKKMLKERKAAHIAKEKARAEMPAADMQMSVVRPTTPFRPRRGKIEQVEIMEVE